MDITTDLVDNIKACRTCGIHYVTPAKNQLKHIFQSCQEHSEIMLIRLQLDKWNVEVAENDGLPQYVCNTCIHKFEQVFQLRTACLNAQSEFRKFYAVSNGHIPNNEIKSEIPDIDEEPTMCDFIYVDELSDGEFDGATPFNIPHIPIKEEIIEAATVPMEDSQHPLNIVECASRVLMPIDSSCSLTTDYIPHNISSAVNQSDKVSPKSLNIVECNLCYQISNNQDEYQHHMQNVHDIRDKKCHICGKEFRNCTSERFKFHMKWHTLNKQFKCNCCNFVCKSKDTLYAHKKAKHRKIICKVCGIVVLAKKIKIHLNKHVDQKQFSCEYCTEAFSTENERENHIWGIHANEDNSMVNLRTNYTHPDDDSLCNGPQEENMLYKFMCAHCEHRFVEQIDLETHVQQEHRDHVAKYETNTALVDDAVNIKKTENIQNLLNHNENAIFDKYDSDNEIQLTNSFDMSIKSDILIQDSLPITPLSLVNENIQKDKTVLSQSSVMSVSENETINISTYAGSNRNTFACAKCSETFLSIEQLREHHEKHLEPEKQQPTTRSKFSCKFCGKIFDLKFRLNRHINKHKNSAPL